MVTKAYFFTDFYDEQLTILHKTRFAICSAFMKFSSHFEIKKGQKQEPDWSHKMATAVNFILDS
jgi:hypothetical protein